jgi:transcriptional regulator with XRE-family HTH domain
VVDNLHEAENLAEFVALLKSEQGDSNATLGAKMGVSSTTIYRLLHGENADDDTLDRIADYAGVTRTWLYALAKDMPTRPRYSRVVSMLAALLEEAPPDIQEDVLALARTLIDRRKKLAAKGQQDDD